MHWPKEWTWPSRGQLASPLLGFDKVSQNPDILEDQTSDKVMTTKTAERTKYYLNFALLDMYPWI